MEVSMTGALASLALAISLGVVAGPPVHNHAISGHSHGGGGQITGPGPGYGYGFPNGNPDGYGWVDYGTTHPIGADRTPEYYFPRYLAVPPSQMFLPSYYNPYITRGQRFIAYSGCGGCHPMGGPAVASAMTPVFPYEEDLAKDSGLTVPKFTGRVEAPPIAPGGSGLTP
jgi:hypothetical protein